MTDAAERVLVWAPRGRDAALAVRLLEQNGMTGLACASVDELVAHLGSSGCAVITEEGLAPGAQAKLAMALAQQAPWSDFPFVLFAPKGIDRTSDAFAAALALGNVTVLERPVQSRTLVSAVVAALRGRRRQYETREAIRRRDEFLAMLGHELRNPLAAIMLATEMSGDKARGIVERQTRHLTRLVDDLLDVARVTSGKITLQLRRVDVREVLRRCGHTIELVARARRIAIVAALPEAPLMIDADPVRLEEIFGNLIANAVKYSPDGTRIELRASERDGACVVEVIDEGVGIAPEMLARVFDLFAQADVSIDRSQGGLGIGLTLVRSLVELHRGTVSAQSAGIGLGSRFVVALPLPDSQITSASVLDPRATPTAPQRGLRVVVVDDNEDLLEMTKDLLENHGCQVQTAIDGHAGLAQIERFRPEIAFLDIGLPGLDGYQVAQAVRERAGSGPRLVAISGYGQPEDRRRALAAGFDDHLTKPVGVDQLLRVIARTAQRS